MAPKHAVVGTTAQVWLAHADVFAARRPDWLDGVERRRWTRYVRDVDRDLYLVAHTHLRATLSRYADVLPGDWRFVQREGGRPELAPGHDGVALSFNLAHTPGLVACVVTGGAACGVDVERAGRVADVTSVAREVLHREEHAAVMRRPEDFLTYWTLKESYLKATGQGLRVALRDVRFVLDGRPRLADGGAPDAPHDWWFEHARPTAAHHLAVALRPRRRVELRWA